jgi:hypothetical protein
LNGAHVAEPPSRARTAEPTTVPALLTMVFDPAPVARRRPPGEESAARRFWASRWTPPGEVVLPGEGPPEAAEVDIDAELSRATAERLGVTCFELFLAALRAVLLRYGNDPVTVAVDLGTRTEETRDRIGMYVNQLPVGGSPEAYADFSDFARATRGELRELYQVRQVPLSHVAAGRQEHRSRRESGADVRMGNA